MATGRSIMRDEPVNRIDVELGVLHSAKPHAISERMAVGTATIAGSLLANALDQSDLDAATMTALLDAIPGAWESAQHGVADADAGRVIALDRL
jgi:hypothetical protein